MSRHNVERLEVAKVCVKHSLKMRRLACRAGDSPAAPLRRRDVVGAGVSDGCHTDLAIEHDNY